jgi:hypothetical protein
MVTIKEYHTKKGTPFILVNCYKKQYRFSKNKNGETWREKAKEFYNKKINDKEKLNEKYIENMDDKNIENAYNDLSNVKTNYPEFKYNDLFNNEESFTSLIIASSKSGKTTFIRELYGKIRQNYDFIIFFSNSIHKNIYDFIKKKDKCFCYDEYNSEIVKFLFKVQKKTNNYFRIAIFLDDVIDCANDYQIKKLFAMGRNSNLSTFMSIQSLTYLNKSSRDNTNYLFLLKNNGCLEDTIKYFIRYTVKVPKKYYRVTEQLNYLNNWVIENTKNYNIIVIDYLDDKKIYKYKVKL